MTVTDQLSTWRQAGDRRRLGRAGLQAVALGVGLAVLPMPGGALVRLGLAGLGAVGLLALAWQRRPTLQGLAGEVDRAGDTRGLLGAGLAVERGGATGGDDLMAQVQAQATAAAPGLGAHAVPTFRVPFGALSAAAAAVVVVALLPEPVVAELAEAGLVTPTTPFELLEDAPEPASPDALVGAAPPEELRGLASGPRSTEEGSGGEAGKAGAGGEGSGRGAGATSADATDGEGGSETAREKQRDPLWRPERPDEAIDLFVQSPNKNTQNTQGELLGDTGMGGESPGLPDADDPTDPDHDVQGGGGEATGKRGEDAEVGDGETPNGETSGSGEGERKPSNEEGGAGGAPTQDQADEDAPTPDGGGDARSKEDYQETSGSGAVAGAEASGTAAAEADQPAPLPDLAFDLDRIDAARAGAGGGQLKEAGEAALGQQSSKALRSLPETYREVAEGALADDAVPVTRQDAVRDYFDTLASGGARDEPAR